MNRFIAAVVAAALAAVLAGCAKEKKDSRPLPPASEHFDKMTAPPKDKGKKNEPG